MSEKASDTPASESAAPTPPAKGGKKTWVMIVAVIVVVALIVSGLWLAGVFGGGVVSDKLSATMTPANAVVVNAGKSVELTVTALWKDAAPTKGTLTYKWTATPSALGDFDLTAQKKVTYNAGKVAGSGTIKCNVTYAYDKTHTYYEDVTATLTVNPPVLDTVVLVPTVRTMLRGDTQTFFATAYNSVEEELPNATITWTVTNLTSGTHYTLNATTGASVIFTAVELGQGWLNATATVGTATAVGTAVVNIVVQLPARNSTTRWYDMFAIPNESFWDMRWSVSGLDQPITHEYPYLTKWFGSTEGNIWIYTSMRMNFTGTNLYEVNMNERPTFLPLLGNYRGGTADINWYANYMKPSDYARYPAFIQSQDDGWIWILNGTVTLDKDAARTVMGIGSTDYDTGFDTWWASNKASFKMALTDWYNYEGKVRLDIYNAYEYPFTLMYLEIEAQKVGDKVVLTYDTVSWGLDVLLSYQLWDAGTVPTNWYFEDLHVNAKITPEYMNMNWDGVAEYAAYAYVTTLESTPCWYWEPLMQDLVTSSLSHPRSNYTPYQDKTYTMFSPGSPINGQVMVFDYTPVAWNLSENETLILEWPSGPQMFLLDGGDNGGWLGTNTTQIFGNMEVRHTEPMNAPGGLDMPPGQFELNNATRTLTFRGPFDFWKWSRDQTLNANLASEWDRIGLLPYGIPTVEFAMELKDVVPDHFSVETAPGTIDLDTATDVTIKVWDQYNRPYPFYNGTVTFYSNDTAAVLPADYTFTNDGQATFSVVFNTKGYRNLTVWQVDNSSVNGTLDMIEVGPEIASFEFTDIRSNVMSVIPFTAKVIARDQFGNVFANYTGTVHFSTTDDDVGVVLPADTTFTLAYAGVHEFTGFVLMTQGPQTLTVTDMATSASGTVQLEVIAAFEQKRDYRVYDLFQEPWGWWWPYRYSFYGTDVIVTSEPGMNTQMFWPKKTDNYYSVMLYAPYRYGINAVNMTTLNVDTPYLMPTVGPPVDGASAQIDVYFQYLDPTSWYDYWCPNWVNLTGGIDSTWLFRTGADGYDAGTVYTVTMNREAAQQWLGMPIADNVATWWAANNATYTTTWATWIDDQGNNVYDIYCGYEWPYQINGGTWMNMVEEADGNVTLTIAHITLGWEILVDRWLLAADISQLQPYWEDLSISASYSKYVTNFTLDGVVQYSLHAVKANGSADGAAWVWEPARIDYVYLPGHPSDYKPYRTLQYQSWNAGDNYLGQSTYYEQTPTWFNLSAGDTLTFELPSGTVPGFKGVALDYAALDAAGLGDVSGVYPIMQNGTMDLGYFVTGWPKDTGLDLVPLYNAATHTLTITGPQGFNNLWHTATGLLYHGVPWIEFNVTPLKAATASAPDLGGSVAGAGAGTPSELLSLMVVMSAAMLAVAAIGASARRKF